MHEYKEELNLSYEMLVAGTVVFNLPQDLNIINFGHGWLSKGGLKLGGYDDSRDTQNMRIENIKSKISI